MLLFSVVITADSLTYLPLIFHTKNYISLIGIVAGFLQIWAVIQILRWRKIGFTLFISSAVVVFFITAINEFNTVPKIDQIITSLLAVLVVNIIILGILYLAIKPVWKNFK